MLEQFIYEEIMREKYNEIWALYMSFYDDLEKTSAEYVRSKINLPRSKFTTKQRDLIEEYVLLCAKAFVNDVELEFRND